MLRKSDKKNKDINTTKNVSVEEEKEEMVEDIIVEDTVEEIDEFANFDDEEQVADDEESVEEDVADEDNEDDEIDEDEDDGDETDAMEDLLTVKKEKKEAQLEEGDHIGLLTDVTGERKLTGKYGPWVSIALKFKIKNPDTGEYVEITFNANRSLDPKSRLYPIVKGILGSEPGNNFNLRELKGKKARVSIEHSTDDDGNVWDNIVAARKYIPKKK